MMTGEEKGTRPRGEKRGKSSPTNPTGNRLTAHQRFKGPRGQKTTFSCPGGQRNERAYTPNGVFFRPSAAAQCIIRLLIRHRARAERKGVRA